MKFIYSPRYEIDIGAHVFPMMKYRRVAERLCDEIPATKSHFLEPSPATDQDILLAHHGPYVHKLKLGTLSADDIARLELPWTPALIEASWLCAGGTILAAQTALEEGAAVHIGGGFHHAFASHGEGFCAVNDIAIGIRHAQAMGKIRRALVVDLDVHQGNGTASIFESDPDVFTFSMHQRNNYPYVKPPGSLDIELEDGCADDEYLALLAGALAKIEKQFTADLLLYVAGADPSEHDQLGGLAITMEGFKRRDAMVFDFAQRHGLPLAAVLAGGYALNQEDTVAIHFKMAAEAYRRWK